MGFCPRCGTETDHRLCVPCLREHHPLIKNIASVQATMCPSCARTRFQNTWSTRAVQAVVERSLERAIVYTPGSRIDGVIVEPLEPVPGKQEVELTVMGSADSEGDGYDEYYTVPILIHGILCTECQQFKNQYFTGILQLRSPHPEVESAIAAALGKACTNIKDVTGGIDFYVSDHNILQNVARQMHNAYGGELSIKAQHFSHDSLTSKHLYRVNAALRLSPFWRGDVVQAGNKVIKIQLMGRAMKGIDLMSGKVQRVPNNRNYPVLEQRETTIATTHPRLTVLDPETYQSEEILNERESMRSLSPGDTVHVVETEKGLIMVHESE